MSERLEERLRSAARTYRMLGNHTAEGLFLEAADTICELQTENDRLRELVRDMWEGYNDPRCEECHLKDTPTCADCPICAREAAVIDRMRELGVEVSE